MVPLYWAATFMTFTIGLAYPAFFNWQAVGFVSSLAKSLFFIPFNSGEGYPYPLLPVGWTLNYEMFFYALWALSMVVFPYSSKQRLWSIAAIFVGLVLVGAVTNPHRVFFRFYTSIIILEFVLGAVLGWVYANQRQSLARVPRPLSVLLIAAGSTVLFLAELQFHEEPLMVEGLASAAIIGGFLNSRGQRAGATLARDGDVG